MKTFKTAKGTELPIMDIKGKDYLQAAPRIVWMREEHFDWSIETQFLTLSSEVAVCQATIRDGQGKIIAQGTSMETPKGFESFVEKAETCAVSRAASFCGYGTLMAQELEEQGKLAESPQDPKGRTHLQAVPGDPAAYIMKTGKAFRDKALGNCDLYALADFSKWIHNDCKDPSDDLLSDGAAIEAFLRTREKEAK